MIKVIKRHDELSSGSKKARMDIAISSTAELVTEYDGVTFTDGSLAWVISTGELYGLLDGVWYNQDGSGAYGSKTEQTRKDTATLDDANDIGLLPNNDTKDITDYDPTYNEKEVQEIEDESTGETIFNPEEVQNYETEKN